MLVSMFEDFSCNVKQRRDICMIMLSILRLKSVRMPRDGAETVADYKLHCARGDRTHSFCSMAQHIDRACNSLVASAMFRLPTELEDRSFTSELCLDGRVVEDLSVQNTPTVLTSLERTPFAHLVLRGTFAQSVEGEAR